MLLIGVVNGGKFDHLQASDDCQCLAFPTMLCGNIFQVGQSLWRAVKKILPLRMFLVKTGAKMLPSCQKMTSSSIVKHFLFRSKKTDGGR